MLAVVGVRFDDNINFGADDQDVQYTGEEQFDDITTSVAATFAYDLIATRSSELSAGITGFYDYVSDFDGLSNYGATVSLDYRGEFGPGFTDPWYSLGVSYTVIEFDDSRIRDGDWIRAHVKPRRARFYWLVDVLDHTGCGASR